MDYCADKVRGSTMRGKILLYVLIIILVNTTSNPVGAQTRTALSYRQVTVLQLPHPYAVAWKPDGTQLAIVSYPSVWRWNVASQKLTLLIADAQVSDLTWSPDGSQIAAVQGGEERVPAHLEGKHRNLG